MTNLEARWRRQNWIQFAVFIGILLSALIAIFLFENLLLSFVVAIVCSYIASPFVSYVEGRGISRIVAILSVYVISMSVVGLLGWSVFPLLAKQLTSLGENLPRYLNGTAGLLNSLTVGLNAHSNGIIHIDVGDRVREWLTAWSTQFATSLPGFVSSSMTVMVLAPILSFFILKDGQTFSRRLLGIVPNNIFELTLSLQSQITAQIGQFIRARMLESVIVGLVVFIGLWIVGFPFPILLALFAGIANLIPYLGPIAGAVPGCVIAFVNAGFGAKLFFVLLVYTSAQLIDMFFIIPLVVARIVDLHPVTVILAIILGSKMLGVLGMLISIPVAAALKVILVNVYRHLTDDVTWT